MRKVCLFLMAFVYIQSGLCQQDTNISVPISTEVLLNVDSLLHKSQKETSDENKSSKLKAEKIHSPKMAAWFSTAVPGLGQIYNRKYWKLPIVYAGLGASGFLIYHYNKQYIIYRTEYRLRLNPSVDIANKGIASTPNSDLAHLGTENIHAYQKQYQRNMELGIIAITLVYILNIVDAAVDAHLMHYDMSNDLSLRVIPFSNNNDLYTFNHIQTPYGLTIQFNF
ncbi:MAG: DUF5683 domain-containing protein [Bacteroidales bacterium]|nr:DUF5683 domain-containing protein [Bacteroidales bacterium]MDD2688316.1 DUF5683 domain-containing protein [Bacteroidales bacterium]MDD3330261.1 DUF5683 domain-containing protein [Bacteroidales bacterium]MDD3690550.1 DUF5683 domain-containing protein [Bacteroidales bacterium]MDD4043895.1 DUF5683 domain-containing protein [Bacteroidales bacterium]